MTVQVSQGPIEMIQGKDFIRTDRGITWGIKCRDIMGVQVVMIVQNTPNGWQVLENLETGFDLYKGDLDLWFKNILQKLNAWLAKFFPANGQPEPELTRFEQADKLIQGIKITVNADGTLTAS